MRHLILMRTLLALFVGFFVIHTTPAQTAADPNEGARLTRGSTQGSYDFSWWGQPGRTYFIQHSEDLIAWEYVPMIESGANGPLSWTFNPTASKCFLRLQVSDIPTNDPFNDDFDGDKVSNIDEVTLGTNPLSAADTDANGLPDDWERFYFGYIGVAPNATAPGGGMTNLQHFQLGSNPNNAPPPPTITAGTATLDQNADTLLYPADDSQLLLQNGNFSQGDSSLPSLGSNSWWPYPSGIPGWTAISGNIIELQQIEVNTTANAGQYCELDSHWPTVDHSGDSDHGIQQTVNLARGRYLLLFDYHGRQYDVEAGSFSVKVKSAGSSTDVTLATKNSASTTEWKRAYTTFDISGSNPNTTQLPITLQFDSTDARDSYGAYIDNVMLVPVATVSRDKFFAGSIDIPQGWNDLELDFVNVTSGENLGRYGSLLGGGTTKIYDAVTDIMNDADLANGSQSSDQKVWFVRDSANSRKINFYTCFNAVGEVQVKLRRNGAEFAVLKHQLTAAQDFADWITYVDNWVKGVGFEFPGGPPGLAGPPKTPSNAANGDLDNLTRACLIPIFNVVAAVEGMEAVALGIYQGVKAGLNDDWQFGKLIISGAGSAGTWAWNQAKSEIDLWRSDPLKRAGELKRITVTFCEGNIFGPLQHLGQGFSTWDGFKDNAWNAWGKVKNGGAKVWAVTSSSAGKLADGISDWFDDFNVRMIQGGEKVAFQNTPWAKDRLVQDLAQYGRRVAYSSGYMFGYICEQVGVGAATGGAVKIGTVAVKGGVTLAGQLAKRTLFCAAARMHLFKKTLASAAVSFELSVAVERGFAQAAVTPFSTTVRESVAEVIETALARSGFDRSVFNLSSVLSDVVSLPRIKQLFLTVGQEGQFYYRLCEFLHVMGTEATPVAAKNWAKVAENCLPLKSGDLERMGELHSVLKTDTAAGRLCAQKTLEAAETETTQTILANGLKISDEIKNVYATMYHYAEGSTLLEHADDLGNGVWRLHRDERSFARFLTPENLTSSAAARNRLQLPLKQNASGVWIEDAAKGRFKVIINTADIADDLVIPKANLHSGATGETSWVQAVVKDNPQCGTGGTSQFMQRKTVTGQVLDTDTGLVILDKNHLRQILGL